MGTGHAVWCAREAVRESFAVSTPTISTAPISFAQLARFLGAGGGAAGVGRFAMVGFRLANTLSEHGTVRAASVPPTPGRLTSVVEHTGIDPADVGPGRNIPATRSCRSTAGVSRRRCLRGSRLQFRGSSRKTETRRRPSSNLPGGVSAMITRGEATWRVLPTQSAWFGVTYREDKPRVEAAIAELVRAGRYPASSGRSQQVEEAHVAGRRSPPHERRDRSPPARTRRLRRARATTGSAPAAKCGPRWTLPESVFDRFSPVCAVRRAFGAGRCTQPADGHAQAHSCPRQSQRTHRRARSGRSDSHYFNLLRLGAGEAHTLDVPSCELLCGRAHGPRRHRRVVRPSSRTSVAGPTSGTVRGLVYCGTCPRVTVRALRDGTEVAVAGGSCEQPFAPFDSAGGLQVVEVGSRETHSRRRIFHILGQNGAVGRPAARERALRRRWLLVRVSAAQARHRAPAGRDRLQEIYHYRFRPETGFGAQFCYDGNGGEPVVVDDPPRRHVPRGSWLPSECHLAGP